MHVFKSLDISQRHRHQRTVNGLASNPQIIIIDHRLRLILSSFVAAVG